MYEQTLVSPRELLPINTFLVFLERRFQFLEAMCREKKTTAQNKPTSNRTSALISTKHNQVLQRKNCVGLYRIYACDTFQKLAIWDQIV